MVAFTQFFFEFHTIIRICKLSSCCCWPCFGLHEEKYNKFSLLSSFNLGCSIAVFLTLFSLQHKKNYMTLNCKPLNSTGLR